MKHIFKYLFQLNYFNAMLLVLVSLITIFLQNIYPFQTYITAIFLCVTFVMMLISPVFRFKNLIYGENRILFLTPKPYSSILSGYLLSEFLIFIIYYLGISFCLFSLQNKIGVLSYFTNLSNLDNDFVKYTFFIFIKVSSVWLLFVSIGVISVILSKKYIFDKMNFTYVKVIVFFMIIQGVSVILTLLLEIILPVFFIRCVLSIYILHLSYRKILGIDIN